MADQNSEIQKSLAKGNTVLGIDIGSSSINVAQSAIHQGQPTIIKVVIENIQVSKEEEREGLTVEALNRALANFNLENADVVCTISNQKTIVDHFNMPLMPPAELAEAVRLEVTNSTHFPIENPIIDFKVLGRIQDKGVEKISVMVAAVSKASIESILSKFKSQHHEFRVMLLKVLQVEDLVSLNVSRAIPISIALENIMKQSKTKAQETIATLEIGTISTELNIYRDSNLEFSRKINVTGLDLTRSLTSALFTNSGKVELTIEEAEWIKKEHGIPLPSEGELIQGKVTASQVLALVRPRLEQIAKEIIRSFDFYHDQKHKDKIDSLLLLGGGAMLKRLPEFLNGELGIPVGIGEPLKDVNFLDQGMLTSKADEQRLALAIGASLMEPKGINLLPEEFRDCKKKFIQRLMMAIGGAAVLIISVVAYLALIVQLNVAKANDTKTKNEYQSLVPQLQELRSKLLIERRLRHRLDWEGLLKQFSHLPEKVFLTNLNLARVEINISGIVLANEKESKKILVPVVEELKKNSLRGVRIASIKENPGNIVTSSFIITAKLE